MKPWLIYLYPAGWRERYGEEFAALLEERSFSFFDLIDILRGALDAHLHPRLFGRRTKFMLTSLRNSILLGFCAYILFVVAGLALYGMVDDSPFIPAMQNHLEFRFAWFVIAGGAVIALLAVLAGGVPIVLNLLKEAFFNRRKDLLWLLAVPVLTLISLIIIYGGTIIGFELFNHTGVIPVVVRQVWSGLFVLAAIASTVGVCLALLRSRIKVGFYRFALLPATLATLAMGLMLAGTIGWGFFANLDAPDAFNDNAPGWFCIIGVMTAATCVAVRAVIHGFKVRVTKSVIFP